MRALDGALLCASRGWHVFPVVNDSSKRPAFKGWQEWATADPDKIQKYAKANPMTNWGVYAGKSGLFIMDLDPQSGAAIKALFDKHGKFPRTFTVKTPRGGKHLYYVGDGPSLVDGLGHDIDTRGRGGYVLAPGSAIRDPNTGEVKGSYSIVHDMAPTPMPTWVPEEIQQERSPLERPDDSDVGGSIGEGKRDSELTRWAGVLRGQGLVEDELTAALMVINSIRCAPPLQDNQVIKIARSIAKKPRGDAEAAAVFASADTDEMQAKGNWPVDAEDYIDGEAPEREWLVENWIPKGEINSLYGSGSTGKSLLALQLSLCIAYGQPFHGQAVTSCRVLYIACEDKEAEVHRRLTDIRQDFPAAVRRKGRLHIWNRVGLDSALAKVQGDDVVAGAFMGELRAYMDQLPPGPWLIACDTVSDVYMGDENTREKVNKLIKVYLSGLALDYDATILLLAHPSRAGQKGDMLSGSTAWENAVRNRMAITNEDGVTTLKKVKSNYSSTDDEITLRWEAGRFVPIDTQVQQVKAEKAERMDLAQALSGIVQVGQEVTLKRVADIISTTAQYNHLFGKIRSDRRQVQQLILALREGIQLGGIEYRYAERDTGRERHWVSAEVVEDEDFLS